VAKNIEVPAVLLPYFEQLVRLGIYGTEVGAVVTFILRKEIMNLVETNVLTRTEVVVVGPDGAAETASTSRTKAKEKKAAPSGATPQGGGEGGT
jgi:hypothetical protein